MDKTTSCLLQHCAGAYMPGKACVAASGLCIQGMYSTLRMSACLSTSETGQFGFHVHLVMIAIGLHYVP